MTENGIREGICHAIQRYAKANNKYMNNYNENKESSYIQYLDANNLYGWAKSQKLPVNGFELVKDISSLNTKLKNFIKSIKNYDEDSDKGYIIEIDVEYPKNLHDSLNNFSFLPERMKIKKYNKLVCNLYIKKAMLFT